MIPEEHEASTRAQESMSLGDPDVRITPDRCAVLADREVEAGIGLIDGLGVGVHPLDAVECVLGRQTSGG